jgi:septum formation protein
VTFAELDDEEISEYVRSGSPLDKAGAYGIQDDRGALYVSRIEGDYYNVVGLPLQLLYRTLRRDFSDLIAPATADHLRPNLYSGANPT